jgi:hypothetical protein
MRYQKHYNVRERERRHRQRERERERERERWRKGEIEKYLMVTFYKVKKNVTLNLSRNVIVMYHIFYFSLSWFLTLVSKTFTWGIIKVFDPTVSKHTHRCSTCLRHIEAVHSHQTKTTHRGFKSSEPQIPSQLAHFPLSYWRASQNSLQRLSTSFFSLLLVFLFCVFYNEKYLIRLLYMLWGVAGGVNCYILFSTETKYFCYYLKRGKKNLCEEFSEF